MPLRNMRRALAALACCALFALPAAQAKITGGGGAAVAALFAAKEEGFFGKRGLDLSILMGGIDSNMPSALVSHSLDIAATSATTFFRAGLIEGAKFVVAEPDKTKEDADRYAKLPPQVLKVAQLSDQVPNINTDDLGWWFGVMKQQGMLTHDLDMKKLRYP